MNTPVAESPLHVTKGDTVPSYPPPNGDCPFCPANGKVEIIAETDAAYLCEVKGNPLQGCYFIIPLVHHVDILCLPFNWQVHMAQLLPKIPWFNDDANYNVNLNMGQAAGQRLSHLHWWVIPRDHEPKGSPTRGLGLATIIANANAAS